jgi:predicted nucleotidyltransferase
MQLPEVEQRTILRGVVGSTVHGLNLEGTDDRDEMGVCLEPPTHVIGLQHFEQLVYRTAESRTAVKGDQTPPSMAGDLDLTIYSLRKWARLAKAGNPSVLTLLYLPESHITHLTPAGRILMSRHGLFFSAHAGSRFLGYLQAQKERLLGTRGQMRTTRAHLIEAHGYDTKYAMHVLRLGYQGVEYLSTGGLTLPMPEPARSRCMAVRRGEVKLHDVMIEVEALENEIQVWRDRVRLSHPEPQHARIDNLLVYLYEQHWRG